MSCHVLLISVMKNVNCGMLFIDFEQSRLEKNLITFLDFFFSGFIKGFYQGFYQGFLPLNPESEKKRSDSM